MRFFSLFFVVSMFFGFAFAKNRIVGAPSLDKIENLLAKNNEFKSVSDFLSRFPKSFLNHYTLVHKTDSIQEASPLEPRVLVFSPDARFVLTFNSDESKFGGRRIEFMEFDDHQNRFDLMEVTVKNGKAKASQRNPALCMGCHTTDPRPFFEPYGFWRGFYGFSRGLRDTPELESAILQFATKKSGHPRYKMMGSLPRVRGPFDKGRIFFGGKNSDMNINLGVHNMRRVIRILQTTSFYEDYKYAIVHSLLCREDWDRWEGYLFPKELVLEHQKNWNWEMAHGERHPAFLGLNFILEPRGLSTLSLPMVLRPLIQMPNGESPFSRWALSGAPERGPRMFAARMIESDPDLFPDFVEFGESGASYYGGVIYASLGKIDSRFCSEIAEKSLNHLSNLLKKKTSNDIFSISEKNAPEVLARSPMQVLMKCGSCHETGANAAPIIPFQNAISLSGWLKNNPHSIADIGRRTSVMGPGQMPPAPEAFLRPEEQATLIKFLMELRKLN